MDHPVQKIHGAVSAQIRIPREKEGFSGISASEKKSFQEVLNTVKFSKHATQRIACREMKLSESDYARLEKGMGMAKQKGIRQTLIMMDNKVFIASVPNNTIITASAEGRLKENIFTNIDGAVIV